MTEDLAPSALHTALRAAVQFDPAAVDWAAGLQTVIPVAALLIAGLAAGDHVAAVTMGAGAMLVGIARRMIPVRPVAGLLALDAALMATMTFLGCVTGSVLAVHLALLCALAASAGLLSALGPSGGALGMQAIIAAVVFGRFSEPGPQALGLAGYVLAGGLTQALAARVGPLTVPLRRERTATAAAYRELAELARGGADASGVPASSALDAAQAVLAHGTWFGDPALSTLRVLVAEGYRLRVQLSALGRLLTAARPDVAQAIREATGAALEAAARALTGDAGAAEELGAALARLARAAGKGDPRIVRRLESLSGQLRGIATLAPAAGEDTGLRGRRRQPRTRRSLPRVRQNLALLRANCTLDSPAARHGIRLAVVVPAAELLARELPLQRSYWMVVAAATVLRPDFGATFTRGAERLLGTLLGVFVAGGLGTLLHPAPGAILVLIAGLGWAGFATFRASFAVGFGFITALVVLLLDLILPETFTIASARLLDTLVGGTFGLIVYRLWPTWSAPPARRALASLVRAQQRYVADVVAVLAGRRTARDEELISAARQARRCRSAAEAALAAALADPRRHRLDDGWSRNALAAARRLVQGAHLLRLELEEPGWVPSPAAAELSEGFGTLLGCVAERIEHPAADPPAALPDLRDAFQRLAHAAPSPAIGLTELDDMVDAAGGLAALVGLDPAAAR